MDPDNPSSRRLSFKPALAPTDALSLCPNMGGVLLGQAFIVLKRRKLRKTINSWRTCPRQFLARISFDIGRKLPWLLEHRHSNIDERFEPVSSREEPTHAVIAKEMLKCSTQATNNWFSLRNREGSAWNRCAQRECTSTHALAAGAMASHRHNRRRSDFEANPCASTFPSQRHEPAVHYLVLLRSLACNSNGRMLGGRPALDAVSSHLNAAFGMADPGGVMRHRHVCRTQ